MSTNRTIDFRYRPYGSQVCIGLVDDPVKSIVWDDGSLCFGYEAQHDPYFYFRMQETVQTRMVQNRGFRYRFLPAILHKDEPLSKRQNFGEATQAIVETSESYRNSHAQWTTFAWQKDEQTRVDVILWELTATQDFQRTRSGIVLKILGDELPKEHLFSTKRLSNDGKTEAVHLEAGGMMQGAFFIVHSGSFSAEDATLENAKQALKGAEAYWAEVRPFRKRFEIPDPQIMQMLQACGRNILQAREIKENVPTYQVGPTVYRGLWIVDGLFLLDAVHMMGRSQEAYDGTLAVLRHVHPDGSIMAVPYHEKETAVAVFTFVRQCRLMQDDKRFCELWPTICRAFAHVKERVEQSKQIGQDYPAYGLFPPSFGDGGINGLEPEYTTPLWVMSGFNAAAKWGKELDLPQWRSMQDMVDDMMLHYRKAYARDRRQTADGVNYVPTSMLSAAEMQEHIKNAAYYNKTGEISNINGYTPQSGTWTLAQAITPGELFDEDDEVVRNFTQLMDACDDAEGIPQDTGWMTEDSLWGYSSMFYGQAFLFANQGNKAADYLYAFANHACPGRCWREEQSLAYKNSHAIWGDMPHNWGAAEFIRLTRNMIVMEKGDGLELLLGLPKEWLPDSEKPLYLEKTPTKFGNVTIRLERMNAATYTLHYEHEGVRKPSVVRVHCTTLQSDADFVREENEWKMNGNNVAWTAEIEIAGV